MNTLIKSQKAIFSLIFLLSLSLFGSSQTEHYCHNHDTLINQTLSLTSYEDYIPDQDQEFQNTPVITMRVNIHFMRNDDGSGMFQPSQMSDFENAIDEITDLYRGLNNPVIEVSPPAEFISDFRVQFKLDSIYYHDDSDYYEFSTDYHPELKSLFGINASTVLNIFYFSYTGGATYGMGHMGDPMIEIGVNPNNYDTHTGLLAHELGHIFQLGHTFNGCYLDDGFDDTFHPDANVAWADCGPDVLQIPYSQCTDLHLYGVSNNLMGYNKCKDYLSPSQMGYAMRAALNLEMLYNLFADEVDTLSTEINDTIIWNHNHFLNHTLTINSGGHLTITDSLIVGTGAKIIVKPGARLYVDGTAIISREPQDKWHGIEVWGQSSLSQIPLSNQGYLKVNNSTIESAECAIQVYRARDFYNERTLIDMTGGVVQIKDSEFNNNTISINFGSYNNTNLSYINNCQFTSSPATGGGDFTSFIEFHGVRGVDIVNSDFIIYPTLGQTTNEGKGIVSYNSYFKLDGQCTSTQQPCDQWDYSTFENLKYGIYAINYTTDRYIDVRHTEFNNTYRGIYASAIDYPRITSCNFSFTDESYYDWTEPYGVYLEECNSYQVENNSFIFNGSTPIGDATGVYILNSGPNYNLIYNNYFESLDYGVVATGENRNGVYEGLCIKCNDFVQTHTDILVTPEDGGPTGPNIGIAKNQGSGIDSDTAAAGNTFTENSMVYNIDNSYGAEHFRYYHHNTNSSETKLRPSPINNENTIQRIENQNSLYDSTSSCPSNLESGGDISKERSTMESASQDASTTEATLQSLEDGGDTEQLNYEVLSSFPDESQELYLDLMSKSPYLSDTVLKSSAEKELVLPDVMIRDIMVDNPQSAKKDDIMDKLENRSNPLPDYMMAQIMEGVDINGAKEILEQEVACYKEKRQQAYRNLQRIFKTDTTLPGATDSLKNLLQDEPSVKAKYELAFLHVQQEEYNQAGEVVNNIPGQFTLTDEQLQENSSYEQLINLLVAMRQDTLAFPSADSAHIAGLWDIVDNGSGKPVLYAGNMLRAMGEMEREEYVYLPSSNKSVEIRDYSNAEIPEEQKLKVYPNPAKGYLVAKYHLENMKSGVIRIITSSGKTVHKEKLQYDENKKMIDLQHLENGTYIVQLYANGKEIQSVKISLMK